MGRRIEYYKDLTQGRELSPEERKKLVRKNWMDIAEKYGKQPDATIRDLYLRKLNTIAVNQYIEKNDSVIDVGCGNGFASVEYARTAKFTLGVDYVQKFIDEANELHREVIATKNLRFLVGDVLDLSEIKRKYGEFDKVISERTLINLLSWDEQMQALDQLSSLLKLKGLLLLTEVTLQGHESIDKIRQEFCLPVIEKHWNNVYLDENVLVDYLAESYSLIARENFSLYILLSRVVNAALSLPNEPSFDAPINEIAFRLSQKFSINDGPGHQVLFVFQKKV